MRKHALGALLILLWGTVVIPGCFFYPGHWDHHHRDGWRDRDHDGRWERNHDDRRGDLMPQHDGRQGDDHARGSSDDKTNG